MATISFSSNNLSLTNTGLNGSGLGFFGHGFGHSVQVGQYNSSTFITDSNGLFEGPQLNNISYLHPASGSINGLAPKNVLDIPNYLATLKITFNHTSSVKTQNAKFICYDRNSINNNPSGLICMAYEIIHPSTVQTGMTGSGLPNWTNIYGAASVLNMKDSPGVSGLSPNGPDTISNEHSWYLAISQSPSSTGNKISGGYFSTEYI